MEGILLEGSYILNTSADANVSIVLTYSDDTTVTATKVKDGQYSFDLTSDVTNITITIN